METTKAVYGQSTTSPMKFHHGSILARLSSTYPTVEAVILEAVQNAVDENPTTIWVDINLKTRVIEIADDGNGASVDEFEREALGSVAESTKSSGKMGRYGLGFIGGLSICELYTFTAVPKRGDQNQRYFEWIFDRKMLESVRQEPDIPRRERLDLRYSKKMAGKFDAMIMYVPWRAAIKFMKVSSDKVIGRVTPETLEGEILARYGVPLRKRNIVVYLRFISANGEELVREIRGKDFQGEALGEIIINPPGTNEFAYFNLGLAPLTIKGRRGVIHFGERGNDYRISDKQFCMSVMGFMDEEVRSVLMSGIFEGEILSSCARFDKDRKSFQRNDDLSNFCIANIEWHRIQGEPYATKIREANKEQRYQKLGIRALDELQHLLKDERYRELIVRSAPFMGTTGVNHAAPKKSLGETDQTGIASQGRKHRLDTGSRNGSDNNHERQPASEEDVSHHPLVAMGPLGKKRTVVKNSSIGLTIVHSEMVGSSEPYQFIPEHGVLEFNIRHPWFVQCDRTDAKLVRYQWTVALHALALNEQPVEWQEMQRLGFHRLLEFEVFQIAR